MVAAGEQAQALIGQRVACVPGSAYSQYAIADAGMCLPLGDVSSEDGASAFVNPMTALGFVETAAMENQKGIIHLAAASNLGQMLVKICQEDGRPLVNIVRSDAQVELLKGLGAEYIVNSSAPDFMDQLRAAIDATDAFCGFDPIGGGMNTDACFKAMEQVAVSKMSEFSRYGSNQQKKMYIYGRLDLGPTTLTPSYGFGFTLSGWLLTLPAGGGPRNHDAHAPARAGQHHHHLRQPLQAQGEPGGNADQGCGDGLPADENRREVPGVAAGVRPTWAPPPLRWGWRLSFQNRSPAVAFSLRGRADSAWRQVSLALIGFPAWPALGAPPLAPKPLFKKGS